MEDVSCDLIYPPTLFDDFLARTHIPRQTIVLASAVFGLLSFCGAAYLDGVFPRVLQSDFLKTIFLQPTISFYILVLQHFLRPSRFAVCEAFRKILGVSREEYHARLARLSPLTRRGEWIALALGAVAGIAMPLEWNIPEKYVWLNLYVTASTWIMFALVGWGAYSSLAVTRLFNRLHHEPLEIDLFRPVFLEAVARRSLAITMAYAGAITLSVIFFPAQTFRNILFFSIVYAVAILIGILIFLLSMSATHQLLVQAKRRELEIVRGRLSESYRQMKTGKADVPHNAVNSWLAYEKRLEQVPE